MELSQSITDLYEFVEDVIYDRVYPFNQEQIDKIIREKMQSFIFEGYSLKYYDDVVLSILKQLEDKRVLMNRAGVYVPVDTMMKRKYDFCGTKIAYSKGLIRSNEYQIDDVEELFDVSTCGAMSRMEVEFMKPAILTGYLSGNDGEYQQPEVSLDEIHMLYWKFIQQGASLEEAVQYILNYYNAVALTDRFSNSRYLNHYKITPNIKKRKF